MPVPTDLQVQRLKEVISQLDFVDPPRIDRLGDDSARIQLDKKQAIIIRSETGLTRLLNDYGNDLQGWADLEPFPEQLSRQLFLKCLNDANDSDGDRQE